MVAAGLRCGLLRFGLFGDRFGAGLLRVLLRAGFFFGFVRGGVIVLCGGKGRLIRRRGVAIGIGAGAAGAYGEASGEKDGRYGESGRALQRETVASFGAWRAASDLYGRVELAHLRAVAPSGTSWLFQKK